MTTTSNKESKELFSFIDKALDCEGSVLDSVDGYNRIRQELVRGFKAAMLEVIKQNTEHEYVEGYELGIDFCVASKLHKALETLVNSKEED